MSVRTPIPGPSGPELARLRRLVETDPQAALDQCGGDFRAGSDPRLLRLKGAALRRLGREEEAAVAEAQAITASTRSPLHRQAAQAIAGKDRAHAEALVEALLAEDSTDVVALVMRGLLAGQAQRQDEADAFFEQAVALAPADGPARLAFARHLQATGRVAAALDQLDLLPGEAADSEAALLQRAAALRALGRLEEEVALLERLRARPGGERHLLALGHAYRSLGRSGEAVAAYRALLGHSPDVGTAWFSLANLKTVRFTDTDIAAMQGAIGRTGRSRANVTQLHFALARAEEDRSDIAAAYGHYAEANRRMAEDSAYDPGQLTSYVDQARELFTASFYAGREGSGSQSSEPVFIVGMQRSGSTLVEQMLASHSRIEGTAELKELPELVRGVERDARRAGLDFAGAMATLTGEQARALGEAYLAATRVHRRQRKPHFTDKLPTNWVNVPLIRLILPRARIVDVRRHPLDCCLSNWKQLYGSGLEHSYDMGWMGRYYADYVRLMRHMDSVQPGAVHRVIYEDLVADVEGEIRRLAAYLGLPFEEAMLRFHANDRSVRTISAEQVRQPINRKGIGQWRKYEQWLDPMKSALGGVLETWKR